MNNKTKSITSIEHEVEKQDPNYYGNDQTPSTTILNWPECVTTELRLILVVSLDGLCSSMSRKDEPAGDFPGTIIPS